MIIEELLSGNASYRSYALVVISGLIFAQFFLILLLMLYAVIYRFRDHRRQVTQRRKNEIWYGQLFGYLEGESTADEFKKLVHRKDYPFFFEFIKEFFLDLAGDEKERLRRLLIYLEIDSVMIRQLTMRNVWKRLYAIYFLGLMDCQRAIVEIRKKIFDKSEVVRMMAISNLMQLRDLDSLPAILQHLDQKGSEENRSQMTVFLMEFGTEILPQLKSIFRNLALKDWIRQVCVDLFGHYVYLDMTEDLVSLYRKTNNIELKICCVSALGKFEDPALGDFFEKVLDNPHLGVKVHAIKALGVLRLESSFSRLEELVRHNDFWMAKRAIEALLEYGPHGFDSLHTILDTAPSKLTTELIQETLNQSLHTHQDVLMTDLNAEPPHQ